MLRTVLHVGTCYLSASTTQTASHKFLRTSSRPPLNYQRGRLHIVTMASSSGAGNGSSATKADAVVSQTGVKEPSSSDDVASHGFTRPDMYKGELVGSVDYFERHVFLSFKDPQSWPPKVEAPGYDPLPESMVAALRNHKNDMPRKTRLTIAEGNGESDLSDGDVLIFPDMVKYKGLGHSDVQSFVDEVLVEGKEWALGTAEPLLGFHIFICAHGSRDKRCGVCGPPLKDQFLEEIKKLGLKDKVFVRFCSHIGGHKYAGNVIVFGPTKDETMAGHWYGYVTPNDVPDLLEQHIGQGAIVDRLWRGQMGMKGEDQKERQQHRLGRLGGEDRKTDDCVCSGSQEQGGATDTANQNGSDLQDKNCRKCAAVLLPRIGSRELHKMEGDEEEEAVAQVPPPVKSLVGRYWKVPKWVQDWESGDTKAALAVMGAAACVAVAYHLYRTSVQQQQ